jgi:hypothetical protein
MSTIRVINGKEYVIPPGTEHVWTPPEEVVVSPLEENIPPEEIINMIKVQGLVRNQDNNKVIALVDKLSMIWDDFNLQKNTKDEFTDKIGNFRNVDLQTLDGFDSFTVQVFEDVILKLLAKSNKK